MVRTMLKSKIHGAKVTDANIYYEGSVTLDPELMEAADILPYEMVHILDVNNGARLQTYAIEGERGSRIVCINGAAARLVSRGDTILILSFVQLPEAQAKEYRPKLVYVDEANNITRVKGGSVKGSF